MHSFAKDAAIITVSNWPLRSFVAAGGGVSFSSPKVSRSGVGAALKRCCDVNHAPQAVALPLLAQLRLTIGRSFAWVVSEQRILAKSFDCRSATADSALCNCGPIVFLGSL